MVVQPEPETLYFRVNGEFIMDLARQGYWFENRQEWAKKLLGTLHGITEEQTMAVLNGDAVLVGNAGAPGETISLYPKDDTEFKAKIAEQKKYQDEHYVFLAGHSIPRDHLDQYAIFVVQRLRNAIQHPGMYLHEPETLMTLEERRRTLHDQLFEDAGFDRIKDKPGYGKQSKRDKAYNEFESALDRYLDEVAPFESPAYR